MIKKWLSYVLAILIASQSLIAIADEHQSHQSGTQHIEHEHEGVTDTIAAKILHEKDQNAPASKRHDCHHCCHCHGLAQFILESDRHIAIKRFRQRLPEYNSSYLSNLLSPDIRPPIV